MECQCKPGYVGDGFGCVGNLMQVLMSTPSFSNFLTVSYSFPADSGSGFSPIILICSFPLNQQILNYSQMAQSGHQFIKRLSDPAVQSTLFVPNNDGLPNNQVSHSAGNQAPPFS